MPTPRLGLVVLGCALVAAAGCGIVSSDPRTTAAAEVGTRTITVAEVQAYLDASLPPSGEAEPPSPQELNGVKSRLLDDYLNAEVLYQEAVRQGISVSDKDLSDYLGTDAPQDPAARERARRDLVIQQLREKVARAQEKVGDAEVDAWLAAHPEEGAPSLHGEIRVLRFASFPEAVRVRSELSSGKLTFDRAEIAYGGGAPFDGSRDVDLHALPDRLAEAVKGLKPGEVSAPVPYETSTLLILLESIDDETAAKARRRDHARQELALGKADAATEALLSDLLKRTKVRIHRRALPFAYVAETGTGGPQ